MRQLQVGSAFSRSVRQTVINLTQLIPAFLDSDADFQIDFFLIFYTFAHLSGPEVNDFEGQLQSKTFIAVLE